jgi:hypothetical protein
VSAGCWCCADLLICWEFRSRQNLAPNPDWDKLGDVSRHSFFSKYEIPPAQAGSKDQKRSGWQAGAQAEVHKYGLGWLYCLSITIRHHCHERTSTKMRRIINLLITVTCSTGLLGANGTQIPSAYFLLDFSMLSSPSWPTAFQNYTLFIASPTHMTRELVDKVHNDIPGSRILAYTDSNDQPLVWGCSTGSPMGNLAIQKRLPDDPEGYYKPLRAGWKREWSMRDITDPHSPKPVCFFPGLAAFVPSKPSIDFLVGFHRNVTIAERGFDGIYMDVLGSDWGQGWTIASLKKKTNATAIDIDGDGKGDTDLDVQRQYKGWRPYFVQELRRAIGSERLILANTDVASIPGLNGVTLEMEICGADMLACLAVVESSRAVAAEWSLPPLDVFWLTHAQQVPPAQQCRYVESMGARFPDGTVFMGSDFYDGSHIVCPPVEAESAVASASAVGDPWEDCQPSIRKQCRVHCRHSRQRDCLCSCSSACFCPDSKQ